MFFFAAKGKAVQWCGKPLALMAVLSTGGKYVLFVGATDEELKDPKG